MNRQYSILNQCLQLVESSDMPNIEKNHVNSQLIQMKRVLSKHSMTNGNSNRTCFDEVLLGLLCQIQMRCGGNCEGHVFDYLTNYIGDALNILGGDHQLA
jgi:hypothetical protein